MKKITVYLSIFLIIQSSFIARLEATDNMNEEKRSTALTTEEIYCLLDRLVVICDLCALTNKPCRVCDSKLVKEYRLFKKSNRFWLSRAG